MLKQRIEAVTKANQVVFDGLQPLDGFARGLHDVAGDGREAGILEMPFDYACVGRVVLD